MSAERHVVDNRVFLLALDHLYREAMKRHERVELLSCARQVASALHLTPLAVPVEGYYAGDEQLTEYFRLMRTLQQVDEERRPAVAGLQAFRRLDQVTSAPLFGRPQPEGKLFAVGRDALSQALLRTQPPWTIARITIAARAAAQELDDISLVGLAARLEDAVVLAALRESVVLYAQLGWIDTPPATIEWQVDDDLAELAARFIDAFNALFGERLPPPVVEETHRYWRAYEDVKVVGRCVRLGSDDTQLPIRHYHWVICFGPDGQLTVHEFWHHEVWTTARYREALPINNRLQV